MDTIKGGRKENLQIGFLGFTSSDTDCVTAFRMNGSSGSFFEKMIVSCEIKLSLHVPDLKLNRASPGWVLAYFTKIAPISFSR